MSARLFQAARTAMQQGKAKAKGWTLEFAPSSARSIDPLMGWTSGDDTRSQVRLSFDSKEAGLAYAASQGLMVTVEEATTNTRKIKPKAYADNFAADRVLRWTH